MLEPEQNSDEAANESCEKVRAEFGWAIEIASRRFSMGLEDICDARFLSRRYRKFEQKHDPVYFDLLKGMEDESLARTFVSYWTIAQTLATRSRFWLEDAVAEIIIHQVREKKRPATEVYSQSMLSAGFLDERRTVADIGETEPEHLSSRSPWEPLIQQSALREIDVLVGEQERERRQGKRKPFAPRDWSYEKNREVIERDREHLARVVAALTGPPAQETTLQCNLLVVEPDNLDGKVHAWGFRFVNPKSIATHATRKQERVNMLRLYALLVQEKILRDPSAIHVGVAALVARREEFAASDRYPDYFSSETYWSSKRLWDFVGVPFEAVSLAIMDVAKEFRIRLIKGLRDLLPEEGASDDQQLFYSDT